MIPVWSATAEKVLKAAFGDKFRPIPPVTPSEDYSEFVSSGVPSMFFKIGVYEPERVAAAREGEGPPAAGQSLALVRAGAEADHRDRDYRDDARCSQCLRSEGAAQMSEMDLTDLILRSRETASRGYHRRPMVRDGAAPPHHEGHAVRFP